MACMLRNRIYLLRHFGTASTFALLTFTFTMHDVPGCKPCIKHWHIDKGQNRS